jgi:hypothetical protein
MLSIRHGKLHSEVIDAFWDLLECSSSQNRRFGEHIASIFGVPQDDTILQMLLWNPLTISNTENGGDVFSETSVLFTMKASHTTIYKTNSVTLSPRANYTE